MIKVTHTCDCCGTERTSQSSNTPQGWRYVSLPERAAQSSISKALLCTMCIQRLLTPGVYMIRADQGEE